MAQTQPDASTVGSPELLRAGELTPAQLDAWRRLADAAMEPNPFFRPEYVLPGLSCSDDELLVLVVPRGSDWLACLPLQRSSGWRRQRFGVLSRWLPDYAYLATPLVADGEVDAAAAAIASFVAAERRAAALVLDPIDADGPVLGALRKAFAECGLKPRTYAEWERAALRRRPEPTYLEEAASGRRRKELRRTRRALGRELEGELELVDRTGDPTAAQAFLDLERETWKGEAGTAMASRPGHAAFFERMCADMADSGHLQILELRAAGRTAALQVNLIDGGTLYGIKVAFDRTLSKFGPGALLEVDALQTFHERQDLAAADSCAAPDNELMNSLWPDRRRMQTVVVPTGGARGKLVGPGLRAEAAARRVVTAARNARGAVRDRRS